MRARAAAISAFTRTARIAGGLLACLGLLVTSALADPSSESCLMCHRDRSLAAAVGRSGSLAVDEGSINNSAHRKMACIDCHKDAAAGSKHPPHLAKLTCIKCHAASADTLAAGVHKHVGNRGSLEETCRVCHGGPHNTTVPAGRAMCEGCHEKVVADYESSVHGLARARGDLEASSCRDCHGKAHEVRPHTDPQAAISRERIDETCAHCHSDRKLMARRGITIPDAVQLFRMSAHGRSNKEGAARCNDCHESHRLKRATDPTSSIYRTNIPTTCAKCHKKEVAAYRIGVHGQALARGVIAAPVCTDCHGEHMIRGPHDPDSPVSPGHITETCARCHEAVGIRQTFGLPSGRLSTYRDSFHGLAARGGSPVVANCASCHGFHDILPSTDPRSLVSSARLATTCGRCHPGAGIKFQVGPVHVAMATPNQPPLYWTRWIYMMLIAGTIGFMSLHNGLDYVRKIGRSLEIHVGRAQAHAHGAARWFERMTLAERIQHFLLATSFFTLVYTGFALKFPEAYPFVWLAKLEGGYRWRGLIHRGAAVVMVIVSLYHIGYMLTARGRKLVADLFPKPQDAIDLVMNMLYLVGLRKAPAKFDRFGYIEKAEYWALIWGTIVMTVTGLVLWFENITLRMMPKWMLDLATLIHYYEAWLAFLAIVVWHLYMNIANPDVYPMNWTWLTGRISEDQLKHEHYLEWERIMEAEGVIPPAHGTPGVAKAHPAPPAHGPTASAPPAPADTPAKPDANPAPAGDAAPAPAPEKPKSPEPDEPAKD